MCVKPKLAMGRFELLNNKYDGNCKSYTMFMTTSYCSF